MSNTAKKSNSNHFIENVRDVVLRGGRMTKYKGQAISCAPMLGTLAVALMSSAAVMLTPTSALAGSCTETGGAGSGIWTCASAASSFIDVTQAPTPAVGGALTVTTSPGFGVSTTGSGGNAVALIINVSNGTYLSFIDTNNAAITGQQNGVYAKSKGTGAITVTTTGAVIGGTYDGIYAYNYYGAGTNLTVSASAVTGGTNGILARNSGTGVTNVTATGAVTGTSTRGIDARNNGAGLTISTAAVTGGTQGIYAYNTGVGVTSVTATGAVTGTSNDGIYAYNRSTTTGGLTVSAAAVTGGTNGIYARNSGAGATSVTATGAVTGTSTRGIDARNNGAGLTISTAAVTGGTQGIYAYNTGVGATSVTVTGTVISTGSSGLTSGIFAYNGATTTGDLTVSAAAVTAYNTGIKVQNKGTGATSVTATGTVISTGSSGLTSGIFAYNGATTTGDLTVSAAAVTGGFTGIKAETKGSGAISVTATGIVTGSLTGISVTNRGSGALSITTSGAVNASLSRGIFAYNGTNATSITINSTAAVTGGTNGIFAQNRGSGATSVTVTGVVTGGVSYGILASGSNTTITLNSGAAVSSSSGKAIENGYGNSTTTVNTGASVAGKISLGAGTDTLTFAGGDFSAVTLFGGGAGPETDVLNFQGSGGASVWSLIQNWEQINIGSGALTLTSTGILNASGDNLALTGDLTNNGTVTMQNVVTGDAITVSGDFSGTGNLNVDINTTNDTADTLTIAGNSSGTTLVTVNNLTPLVATGNDITLVTIGGTSAATDFALSGGAITAGAFDYDLKYQTGSFVLAKLLNSTGATYLVAPTVLGGFNNLQSMEQRIDGRAQRPGQAAWISFHGRNSKATMTSGSNVDSSLWGFQVGTDLEFDPGTSGRWVLGFTGQYGRQSSTMTDPLLGTGQVDTTGSGVGLSATWYSNDGTYVDTQGQVNWLNSDLSSSSSGLLVKGHNSTAYALSVEAGHRFILNATTALVPQAQVTWSRVNGGSFTDNVGNSVNLGSNTSTVGRIGMAYEFARKGAREKFYVIGNLVHDFSSNNAVTVTAVAMNTAVANPTSAEIGFGGTKLFGGMELYGEASVSTALGSVNASNNIGIGGTLGLRMKF